MHRRSLPRCVCHRLIECCCYPVPGRRAASSVFCMHALYMWCPACGVLGAWCLMRGTADLCGVCCINLASTWHTGTRACCHERTRIDGLPMATRWAPTLSGACGRPGWVLVDGKRTCNVCARNGPSHIQSDCRKPCDCKAFPYSPVSCLNMGGACLFPFHVPLPFTPTILCNFHDACTLGTDLFYGTANCQLPTSGSAANHKKQ